MAQRLYENFQEALKAARMDYDHSKAKIVKKKMVRKSRKMAFLFAKPTEKSQESPLKHNIPVGSKIKTGVEQRTRETVEKLQVLVATPLSSTLCLQLPPSTAIAALKDLLQDKLGIHPENQRLFLRTNFELCDALTLADHGVEQDANIELRIVSGLLGGMGGKKNKSAKKRKRQVSTAAAEQTESTADGQQATSATGGKPTSAPEGNQASAADGNHAASTPDGTHGNQKGSFRDERMTASTYGGEQALSGGYAKQTTPVVAPLDNRTKRKSISEVATDRTRGDSSGDGKQLTMSGKFTEEAKKSSTALPDNGRQNDVKRGVDTVNNQNVLEYRSKQTTSNSNNRHGSIEETAHAAGANQDAFVKDINQNMSSDRKHSPRGADESSNQNAPEDDTRRIENVNFYFSNCPITLGNSTDCQYHYEFPAVIDVTKEGKVDHSYTQRLHQILMDNVRSMGKTHMLGMIFDVFKEIDSELARVERGSVKLILHVKSQEGLDKLWKMFTSGELATKLTDILITKALTTEDRSNLAIAVKMSKSDYEKGCKFFSDLKRESTTQDTMKCMSTWSKDRVREWLVSIGVSDSAADQMYQASIDGKVLELYTKEDLCEDFNMTIRDMRLILCKRRSWLESEEQRTPLATEKPTQQMSKEFQQPCISSSTEGRAPFQESDSSTEHTDETPPPSVSSKSHDQIDQELKTNQQVPVVLQIQEDSQSIEVQQVRSESLGSVDKHPTGEDLSLQATSENNDNAVPLLSKVLPLQESSLPETSKHEDVTREGDERNRKEMAEVSATSENFDVSPLTDGGQSLSEPCRGIQWQEYEARLRMLLTGDKRGKLDQSHYPVLVANTPPVPQEETPLTDQTRDQFHFIKMIKWTAVLDFNSKSQLDGLCKLYHDDRVATLQQPDLFRHIENEEEFQNSIGFPERTLWIFANGREDDPGIQIPRMNLQEWNTERSGDVEASVTFFSQPSVIPKGREVIVFLLLSEEDIEILCDTFRKMSSSFRGLQNITCIAQDQHIYLKFVKGVERWFPSKEKLDERSVVGIKWQDVNYIMKRMNNVNKIKDSELPSRNSGVPCLLSEKRRQAWSDITVICKNECENTDMDESNPDYNEFVERKELKFYHGESVDWWNFALGELEVTRHRGCGHVLKRNGYGKLLKSVNNALESSQSQDSLIVTVTLLHQPGAGGSTLARHVLWELHRNQRCIVVNRVTNNTVHQIMDVRRYGYKTENTRKIPPVCILIDNLDDVEVLDLIAELEEVSKDIHLDGGSVCVLLRCKRHVDPDWIIKHKSKRLAFPLNQKLDKWEKEWFEKKYLELEKKEKELSVEYKPDNLLAFMVMKEEFNSDYIKNVVTRILQGVKDKEFQLIKLFALLNSYRPEGIPISCCDMFMTEKMTSKKTTHLTRRRVTNWEKTVSSSFRMIVINENRAMKIFHKSIAEEALKQIRQICGQSLADVTIEFLQSELLESPSHSRQDLKKSTHALLIRRKKQIYGDSDQTDFSVLIEDIREEHGHETATQILKTGFEKLKDARVAQQIARLYLKKDDFVQAHVFADKALEIDSKNSYFLDTKGRIYKKQMDTESEPYLVEHQVLDPEKCCMLISISYKAMDAFRRSYDVSKEAMQIEYTGLYAEIDMAFRLLQVIRLCVEPFRTNDDINVLRKYLQAREPKGESYPKLDKTSYHLLTNLVKRVDTVLGIMDDISTHCKDSSSANIVKQQLDKMRENMRKYAKIYEDYYGEPKPVVYDDQNPGDLAEYRRRKVKQLQCGTLLDIFDLVRQNDLKNLRESRKLLMENRNDFNFFDLKILICIHLALSSIGERLMSADEVYQRFVRPFNALDNDGKGLWPPFVMMMFLWPLPNVKSERRDREDVTFYIDVLKGRWDGGRDLCGQQPTRQDQAKCHTRQHSKAKTHFFLGHGEDLKVFAHITELQATQSNLDRRDGDDEFWQSSTVKDRLVRLEGILFSNISLMHRSQKGKIISIKLAVPFWKKIPSQEAVTFYLGFSWNGPVAYNVTLKGQESSTEMMSRFFHKAYPKDILPTDATSRPSPSDNISKIDILQKKRQKLSEQLRALQASLRVATMESKKAEIQREITSKQRELDKKTVQLKYAWQDDTYDCD